MKYLFFFIVLWLTACEGKDFIRLEQRGYVAFNMQYVSKKDILSPLSKVPECLDSQPVYVKVRLLNEYLLAHTDTARIAIENDRVFNIEELSFPINQYDIDEVSLMDAEYNITHTVPHYQKDVPFVMFTEQVLPIPINITPGNTSPIDLQVLCVNESEYEIDGEPDVSIEMLELETLLFYVPPDHCIDSVSVQFNTYPPIYISDFEVGINETYVLKSSDYYRLNSYINGLLLESHDGTDYNPDDILDSEDVVVFDIPCL